MKKLLCGFVIAFGGLAYSSVLLQSWSSLAALTASLNPFRSATLFGLCAVSSIAMVILWKKGRIPFGFFLNVLGGFFLGAASRSPSPSAELNATVGFALFVIGYLIVRREANYVSLEREEPPNPALQKKALERLLEAAPAPSTRVDHPLLIEG